MTPAIASGCNASIHVCGSSGRDWNTNTHESAGQHQALLITRKDYQETTGMSDEQWEQNRDDCWVQKLWSATINDKGAYFCEVAGALDRLYFDGKHAWGVEQGWWQRTPWPSEPTLQEGRA